MRELSKFELATVKRTAASVKMMRRRKSMLEGKIAELQQELIPVISAIEKFEAPIVELTGGFTSEQVLNGDMDAALSMLTEITTPMEVTSVEPVESVEPEVQPVQTETTTNEAPANPFQLFGNVNEATRMPFEEQ